MKEYAIVHELKLKGFILLCSKQDDWRTKWIIYLEAQDKLAKYF